MATYVEYQLADGATLLVEADAPVEMGVVKASREIAGNVINAANLSFEDSLAGVRRSAEILVEQLRSLHTEEITVTFKLKATGQLGFAIARGSLEANYEVTLKWKS
jgi:hypothetical protein